MADDATYDVRGGMGEGPGAGGGSGIARPGSEADCPVLPQRPLLLSKHNGFNNLG